MQVSLATYQSEITWKQIKILVIIFFVKVTVLEMFKKLNNFFKKMWNKFSRLKIILFLFQ